WRAVTRIGGGRCVAAGKSLRHRGIPDRSRPSAVADRFELAVPSGRGQPDLDLDVRVPTRLQRGGHAAERWQGREARRVLRVPTAARRPEPSRRYELGDCHRRVLQRQRPQTVTRTTRGLHVGTHAESDDASEQSGRCGFHRVSRLFFGTANVMISSLVISPPVSPPPVLTTVTYCLPSAPM